MKRILFSIALFSSVYLSAQTVIIDEKIEDTNYPINFEYLPNAEKFVMYRGERIKMTASYLATNASAYDSNGKRETLFENQELYNCSYSITEKSFMAYDVSKSIWTPYYKIFVDNKPVEINPDNRKEMNFSFFSTYFGGVSHSKNNRESNNIDGAFNDLYVLGFSNQKNKGKIDFEKDNIFLEVLELKTGSRKRFPVEKPDLTLLQGDSFAKTNMKVTFRCKLNGNENFDLITKSVSKDFKKVILYKATYNLEGKKIKTIPFTLELTDKFFVTSGNDGGPEEQEQSSVDLDNLSINNYLEDRKTGDLYVYGIYSDENPKKIGDRIHPNGFYVFKFDKEGNKVWESINKIDGKDFFEKIRYDATLKVSLAEYNKNLVFQVYVNSFTEFTNASVVDKSTGSILKTNFLEYNNNASHEKLHTFISYTYDYVGDLRKKSFSQKSFAAIILNENLFKYLKSIPEGDTRLHFTTLFTDQGIWLVETDNKKYYKVLLFKD